MHLPTLKHKSFEDDNENLQGGESYASVDAEAEPYLLQKSKLTCYEGRENAILNNKIGEQV